MPSRSARSRASLDHFSALRDPREGWRVLYPLSEILLLVLCYCARGDMENRIEECQAVLFADRTSAASFRAKPLRLWFTSLADVLRCALRRIGLRHTGFAEATCGTIRLKLFKVEVCDAFGDREKIPRILLNVVFGSPKSLSVKA